jgi:hypothetical protein
MEQGLISASAVAGELRVGVTTGGFTDSSRDESTDTPRREYMRAKDKITNL